MTGAAFTRYLVALVVCAPALVLPYRARAWYGQAVAWCVHAPAILFGRVARVLLRRLSMKNPYADHIER